MARTRGQLSLCACARGVAVAAGQQLQNLVERAVPRLVRRLAVEALPEVPDSRLVRLAEEAALEQDELLLRHGFRTSAFGRALAHGDGVAVDPELLHVAAILHDVGLMRVVVGEDFTIRSAAAARRVADAAGEPAEVGLALEDALLVHTTVGINPSRDGALGAYTQFGAMLDLTGLRLRALPRRYVEHVLETHPRGPFKRALLERFEAEARAVPRGRFGFARRVGFAAAVRWAPFGS